MTIGQLELPLFDPVRSTADNPVPEQDRTHLAQMIIKHCGGRKRHVAHAYDGPYGCPGTPDLRDSETVARQAHEQDEMREQVRAMEVLTYDCGERREFHDPHTRADGRHCAGLQSKCCGVQDRHTHHRWWVIPDAFYWCDGAPGVPAFRGVTDVVADL